MQAQIISSTYRLCPKGVRPLSWSGRPFIPSGKPRASKGTGAAICGMARQSPGN